MRKSSHEILKYKMESFRNFINKTTGKVIWLILIFTVLYLVQDNILAWFFTAFLSWFAIEYSNEITYSKHKRLWKTVAILTPPLAYIVYLAHIVIQSRIKNKINGSDSSSIKNLKSVLLLGNIFLFCVIVWFFQSFASIVNLEASYLEQKTKQTNIENKIDEQLKQTNESIGHNTNTNKPYLKLLEEQLLLAKLSQQTQKKLQSIIFYKYNPENNQLISLSIVETNNYISAIEADIDWATEAVKDSPDENKLDNLIRESNEKKVALKASTRELETKQTSINLNHQWAFYAIATIGIFVTLLFGSSILLFIKTEYSKVLKLSMILGAVNLLVVVILTVLIFR